MIIKPIDEIVTPGASIVEINKIRMKKIQDNAYDFVLIDELFFNLEKALLKRDLDKVEEIISKKLFFEVPCVGLAYKMIKAYENHTNKKYFIDELKKSYLIRGIKGVQFAWIPILNRGN